MISALEELRRDQKALAKKKERLVRAARRDGASWAAIGDALGVTQQTISAQFGPYPKDKPRVNPRPRGATAGRRT